jgi:hypothetical protein
MMGEAFPTVPLVLAVKLAAAKRPSWLEIIPQRFDGAVRWGRFLEATWLGRFLKATWCAPVCWR